jgi:hypothetical protein
MMRESIKMMNESTKYISDAKAVEDYLVLWKDRFLMRFTHSRFIATATVDPDRNL